MLEDIPTTNGSYILLLQVEKPSHITVGKLGEFAFDAGWYAYVGSAHGRGGLRGRLKHHVTSVTKPHWHIDYLRQYAELKEIWSVTSYVVYEHELAFKVASMPDARMPVPRFGASDCKCPAHLTYFADKPDFSDLQIQQNMLILGFTN